MPATITPRIIVPTHAGSTALDSPDITFEPQTAALGEMLAAEGIAVTPEQVEQLDRLPPAALVVERADEPHAAHDAGKIRDPRRRRQHCNLRSCLERASACSMSAPAAACRASSWRSCGPT